MGKKALDNWRNHSQAASLLILPTENLARHQVKAKAKLLLSSMPLGGNNQGLLIMLTQIYTMVTNVRVTFKNLVRKQERFTQEVCHKPQVFIFNTEAVFIFKKRRGGMINANEVPLPPLPGSST